MSKFIISEPKLLKGKIYLIGNFTLGHIKIGFTSSSSAQQRLIACQTGSSTELCLLAVINGTSVDETKMHKELEKWKTNGGTEWFRLCTSNVHTVSKWFGISNLTEWLDNSNMYQKIRILNLC